MQIRVCKTAPFWLVSRETPSYFSMLDKPYGFYTSGKHLFFYRAEFVASDAMIRRMLQRHRSMLWNVVYQELSASSNPFEAGQGVERFWWEFDTRLVLSLRYPSQIPVEALWVFFCCAGTPFLWINHRMQTLHWTSTPRREYRCQRKEIVRIYTKSDHHQVQLEANELIVD